LRRPAGDSWDPLGVRLAGDAHVRLQADAQERSIRYVRAVKWLERQLERLRSLNPLLVDGVLAGLATILGIISVFAQDMSDGMTEPGAVAVVTAVITSAPVAIRRRAPLLAVAVACGGILVHIVADYPEGVLPVVVLFLTYSVAAWSPPRRAVAGLGIVYATLMVVMLSDTPGFDTIGLVGNLATYGGAWAIGLAVRSRRETTEVRVRAAEERADVERQRAGRVLAEERLRIAQELHDVVAHSMSVIAVQAGVGAHMLESRPDQARSALDAISATSRGTLAEMRRLLGVLRDTDGERVHTPTPGLADLRGLVEDVRAAGVPVTLDMSGSSELVHAGVELSAYRIVQEALTNVIKHAGAPTRVDVNVRYLPGCLEVQVVDDGRGAAAVPAGDGDRTDRAATGSGQGLLGMRERVELWGGELSVGPVTGGGYRVKALLPYGDPE
jgi:signal transduction histidine kinase